MAEADPTAISGGEDAASIKSTSSTTSEEDAADKKEQLPQTPEIPKPEYNDEQLTKLVDYIQRMTMLFAFDQRDWNEAALDAIRRWLLEVDYSMLTIFYDKNVLKACLGFPMVPVTDLSYFIREDNQIFTVEGFHDEVHFGTVHDDVEGCLLHVLRWVYAPMFRNCMELNENLRFRLCKALDRLLTFLTSLHYKMAGETVIYVPYIARQLADDKITEQREFIKNVEKLVLFWSTQIRTTLLGDKVLAVSNDLVTPQEEYDFWLYRCEVLQGISCQLLAQPEVQQIFGLMKNIHSVYLQEIEELLQSCRSELNEAKSNIKFLTLVIEPCAEIEKMENPAALPPLLPRIIHLIRYVWLKSDYYNRPELIGGLFAKLSNQIIKFCTRQVNIGKVLGGHSRFGMKMANMSIDCCLAYKEIYTRISAQHAKRPNQKFGWNLDNNTIFNHVDAFVERLNDVIEICEAMVVFGRLDETETIPKPCFGGTDGVEFDKTIDRVEEDFKNCMTTLRSAGKKIILNVHQNDWYKHATEFRRTVKKLEETVQRLTSNAFQRIANIEEGLEVLNATLFYSYHSVIRKTYLRQVSDIWRMFNDDMLKTAKQLHERPTAMHESWLPPFASRAINYRINLERLQWLRDRLYNSDWLPKVPEEKATLAKFEAFRKDFEKEIRLIYDEWYQHSESATLLNKLQRPLLVRSNKSNPGLLECNIDRNVLSICQEAEHFERLGFQVTGNIHALYDKHETLRNTYNEVVKVCLDYNHIVSSLAPKERELFKAFIQTCDRQIAPGLSKLTWNTEYNKSYFDDCASCTECLRESFDVYKRSNKQIALACEQICNTPFLKMSRAGPMELVDFESHMQKCRKKATKTITAHYNAIVELLNAVHGEFQPYISEMATEWSAYVQRFDNMLETALLTSARNALLNVCNAILHSETKVPAAPILIAELNIGSGEVQLNPEISSIRETISGLLKRIVESLESFPRLQRKLRCFSSSSIDSFSKIFTTSPESRKLQQSIESELDFQQKALDEFLQHWQSYEDVWLTTEKQFIEKLKATERSAKIYADSIEYHSNLAETVVFKDSITQVHFILLNQNPIKNVLLDMIEKWQRLNIKLLTRRAFSRMRQIHRYMDRHGSRITVVPRSVQEARRSLEFYNKLVADASQKIKDIPRILELFKLLDKHQINVPEDIREIIFTLDVEWETYMQRLIEADELLESNREDFRRNLSLLIDECKAIMKEFFLESKIKRSN